MDNLDKAYNASAILDNLGRFCSGDREIVHCMYKEEILICTLLYLVKYDRFELVEWGKETDVLDSDSMKYRSKLVHYVHREGYSLDDIRRFELSNAFGDGNITYKIDGTVDSSKVLEALSSESEGYVTLHTPLISYTFVKTKLGGEMKIFCTGSNLAKIKDIAIHADNKDVILLQVGFNVATYYELYEFQRFAHFVTKIDIGDE